MGQVKEMPNKQKGFTPATEGLAAVKSIAHGEPLETLEQIFDEQGITLTVSRWLEEILTTDERDRKGAVANSEDVRLGLTMALVNNHMERMIELGRNLNQNAGRGEEQ